MGCFAGFSCCVVAYCCVRPIADVWSLGCVFAELLLGGPLFPGESGVDQLVEIIKILGTPSREEIQAMNSNYTEFKFPQIKAHPWQKVRLRQATKNISCQSNGSGFAGIPVRHTA